MEINFHELWVASVRFLLDIFKREGLARTVLLYALADAFMVVIGNQAGVVVALAATVVAIWLTRPTFRIWWRKQADA